MISVAAARWKCPLGEAGKTKLLKKITESGVLASLSPLAIQLVELAADDESSASDLAAVIEKDPGLTTRLLKLVGSAFFSLEHRVNSISHAITLLGFKRVRIMALSLSLRDTFPLAKKGGMDYNLFWKTSLYRALIAQDFSSLAKPKTTDGEEAFVAGLILEIGMPMLYEAVSKETGVEFLSQNLALEEAIPWEEQSFGINHREVGRFVLARWRFSEDLIQTQRWFGPEALEPDKPRICKVVDLARRATEAVFGRNLGLHALHELVKSHLQLESHQVHEVLSGAFEKVDILAEQLRIDVDSQKDIVALMEKANQALARISGSMEDSLRRLLSHVSQFDRSLDRLSEEMAQRRRDILQNTLDAVAHEIRNPLLAIGGFARRLTGQIGGEGRGKEYARIIEKESTRLESILKEITEYSRLYEPEFSVEDLVELIAGVLEEMTDDFEQKKIQVVCDFPQQPVPLRMDGDGIRQVFRQLFTNAARMVPQDEGRLIVSVQPLEGRGEVAVEISDNGGPIPEDLRSAFLDSNLSAKSFHGGLGLPLARKIIEVHHGRIEIEAKQGEGNKILLQFPMK